MQHEVKKVTLIMNELMNLMLRNKQQCIFITGLTLGLTLIALLLNYNSIIFWNKNLTSDIIDIILLKL